MPNFTLFNAEADIGSFKNYHLARIDGAKALTMNDFFVQIEKALLLPDYFSHNLDSLDEMLNDLEWIKNTNVALVIVNFDKLLANEKKKNKLLDLLNLFDATAEDWKWLDDDDDSPKKNLRILIQNSPQTVAILQSEGIGFDVLDPPL